MIPRREANISCISYGPTCFFNNVASLFSKLLSSVSLNEWTIKKIADLLTKAWFNNSRRALEGRSRTSCAKDGTSTQVMETEHPGSFRLLYFQNFRNAT
jgi:hypothetical protein